MLRFYGAKQKRQVCKLLWLIVPLLASFAAKVVEKQYAENELLAYTRLQCSYYSLLGDSGGDGGGGGGGARQPRDQVDRRDEQREAACRGRHRQRREPFLGRPLLGITTAVFHFSCQGEKTYFLNQNSDF